MELSSRCGWGLCDSWHRGPHGEFKPLHVGQSVLYCELFAGRSLFRMGQSAPGEVAEMDFGRLGCSYSVDFPEGLTLRGIHHGPGNHGSGLAQPSPRPPPRPGCGALASCRACALCPRIR